MADRDNVVVTRGTSWATTLLAWIALIAALIALWLAWVAYDRTGTDLDERIQQEVRQGVQGAENVLDAGPDGIDEDDTETTSPQPAPTPAQ